MFGFVCEYEDVCAAGVQPCLNGGACRSANNVDITCICGVGFAGERCETDCWNNDDCTEEEINPCLRGSCGPGACSLEDDTFECDCADTGYQGKYCDEDIDECAVANANAALCKGQGICENTHPNFRCMCFQGFSGPNCAERVKLELEHNRADDDDDDSDEDNVENNYDNDFWERHAATRREEDACSKDEDIIYSVIPAVMGVLAGFAVALGVFRYKKILELEVTHNYQYTPGTSCT